MAVAALVCAATAFSSAASEIILGEGGEPLLEEGSSQADCFISPDLKLIWDTQRGLGDIWSRPDIVDGDWGFLDSQVASPYQLTRDGDMMFFTVGLPDYISGESE